MSCRNEEEDSLLYRSDVESTTNAVDIADVGENNDDHHFRTLNLFRNTNSLLVYYRRFLNIADEAEKVVVEKPILFFSRLDAWTIVDV